MKSLITISTLRNIYIVLELFNIEVDEIKLLMALIEEVSWKIVIILLLIYVYFFKNYYEILDLENLKIA